MTSPRCIDLLFVTLAILAPIGSSGYAASEYPPEIASIAGEIAERIAKSKAKTKGGVNEPQLIVLASTYSKELLSALAIHSGRLKIGDQDCAVRTIQELKLPPKEYLHYAAAAWLARECEASLVVIAGSEKSAKAGQIKLNVAILRAKDGRTLGFASADVPPKQEAITGDSATGFSMGADSSRTGEADGIARAGRDGVGVPACLYCPNPSFTEEAGEARNYIGRVLLRVVVTAEGTIEGTRLVEGAAFGLNEQAISIVNKWRLKPALDAQQKPVPAWTTIEVIFREYATAGRDNSIVPQCEYCPSPVADCTPKKAAGVVLLRLMITTDGKPENISIVKGIDSCLDQKALAEVRKWRFTPAHGRNGEPVPFWTTLEIRFRQY